MDVGDRPRLTVTFLDINKQPTDPFAVNCHVKRPSGVTTVYTYNPGDIAKTAVGVYVLDFPLLEPGDYRFKWNSSDASGVPEAADQGFISARRSLA